jgi:hypothetical protein
VRGHLFGTDSLEKSLKVVVMGVHKWVGLGMVRVHISALDVLQLILVVALAVNLLVDWLLNLLLDFIKLSCSLEICLFKSVTN